MCFVYQPQFHFFIEYLTSVQKSVALKDPEIPEIPEQVGKLEWVDSDSDEDINTVNTVNTVNTINIETVVRQKQVNQLLTKKKWETMTPILKNFNYIYSLHTSSRLAKICL